MCFEFTLEPASPQAGQIVTIDAKTLWLVDGIDEFSVRLWTPERSTSVVALSPMAGEQRWRGTVVFDRPGTWAVQAELAHPTNEYGCFYATVQVRPALAYRSVPDPALIAAIGFGVVVIGALAVLAVRRLRVARPLTG
jgi:hypothetical protein